MTRRVVVISAGLREPSSTALLAERLVEAVEGALADRGIRGVVEIVQLRHHGQAILQAMTSFAPRELERVFEQVATADGVIALTPVYNASYGGLFKSFIDVLPEGSLRDTPVLLGATGGTPRHSLAIDYALRPLFAYLHAEVMPTAVYAATADWGATPDDVRPLPERIARAGEEFAARLAARPPRAVDDEFARTPGFAELLARVGSTDLEGGDEPASPVELHPERSRAETGPVVQRDARLLPGVVDVGEDD